MSNPADERRRFHRIATDKPVKITAGSAVHPGTVLDLSLRGLLFEVADDWQPTSGTAISALLELDGELCCIQMEGEVAHVEGNHVGMHCTAIDLDSASRLRRMVELNLADEQLLERDLAELIAG
ncbi:MAG: PilZ domain-containing protein [Chromatiaceae bacterium]|nr:PilZ domain-containing protein [Gammaproteobacteria bacterium]MCP5304564.1 PilZ domain-containing protein [Chromatiaceae bacterium]MCP5314291.1 PilZ domain-containing protein [Chromatiaceae bacterium]